MGFTHTREGNKIMGSQFWKKNIKGFLVLGYFLGL